MFGRKLRNRLEALERELGMQQSQHSYQLALTAKPGEVLPELASVEIRQFRKRLEALEETIQKIPTSYVLDPGRPEYVFGSGWHNVGRREIQITDLLRLLIEHTGLKLVEIQEVPLKPRHFELEPPRDRAENETEGKSEIQIERTY